MRDGPIGVHPLAFGAELVQAGVTEGVGDATRGLPPQLTYDADRSCATTPTAGNIVGGGIPDVGRGERETSCHPLSGSPPLAWFCAALILGSGSL